jgi:23S rRNA pseudouridine1911/1915/1917 synthase
VAAEEAGRDPVRDETRAFPVDAADAGARLDAFLAARLGTGRTAVRALLERGAVRIDGRRVGRRAKGAPLVAGSRVEVQGFAPATSLRPQPEPETPLTVLAHGDGWIALDKPAGYPIHPLREDERGSLLGALVARRPEILGVGEGGLRSGVVHRLDVDTSGVVLFATEQSRWERLREGFRHHRIEKRYRALVEGRLEGEGSLVADLVVARHRPARVRVVDLVTDSDTRPAAPGVRRTALGWRALAHGPAATLVEVRPRTGFLHQIRATFAFLGHPVWGDRVYGGERDVARQMLHASQIAFEEIEAASPDPPDFGATVRRLVGPGAW